MRQRPDARERDDPDAERALGRCQGDLHGHEQAQAAGEGRKGARAGVTEPTADNFGQTR